MNELHASIVNVMEMKEENARLRELNAEMLAALKQLVADYGDVPDPTDADGQAVMDHARAVIARAEGK